MTSFKRIARPALRASLIALTATGLTVPAAAQESPLAMTAEDLVTMPQLGSAAVNPDGTYAVYSVRTTDRGDFSRETSYYLRSLTDLGAAPVMLDMGGDASALTFGTDGKLYFLSERSAPQKLEGAATAQVWRADLAMDGTISGAQLVTSVTAAIGGFLLSPDNTSIALFGDIARECATFGCPDADMPHLPGPGDGRLYSSEDGFFRHWDQWETPGTYGRVFAFPLVNGRAQGTGVAMDGAAGGDALVADTPTKPFGGDEEIAWAADGSGIFFAARKSDGAEPTSTNVDIYFTDLAGGTPENLTPGNLATDNLPAPSPDGKWLAYAAMERPGYESDRMVIQLRDLATGQTRALTGDFDRSFGSLAWTPDSRHIIASAQDVLDTPAFRIDIATGEIQRLDLMAGNEARIYNLTPLTGDRLLFTRNSIHTPSELYISPDYGQADPLTDVTRAIVGQQAAMMTTRFNFAGADGDTVWGQITKPENHTGKLPAILYIHGGPQGSFNDGWSSRWNPRVLASQGYAVISVDFHGSTGYGQAFTDSINRDWGGKPLEDLQKGLAAALTLDSQIDGSRACAMGASYGGYMVNWIAGNWPDRFKCLIQHDGLFDMRSFYYTTEELWFPRWDFGGSYAEQSALYEKWNPVNHVQNWQTPMLVVAGEQDFRVPYTQGLASFTALQEQAVPSQLLVFPTENHWVLGRENSLQWHQTVFGWLDRWLSEEGDAAE